MQSRPNHLLYGEEFWFNFLDILGKLEEGNDRHFVVFCLKNGGLTSIQDFLLITLYLKAT